MWSRNLCVCVCLLFSSVQFISDIIWPLQLHGHWAVWRGCTGLWKGLPDWKNFGWDVTLVVFNRHMQVHTHTHAHPFCDTLEHKQLLKTAQLELKKSKRKDYYKVLGVCKNATEDEIKKAYRKRALMHHPGIKVMTKACQQVLWLL